MPLFSIGDHIRERGCVYDHHMIVVEVIDKTTVKVIDYSNHDAGSSRSSTLSFGSTSGLFSGSSASSGFHSGNSSSWPSYGGSTHKVQEYIKTINPELIHVEILIYSDSNDKYGPSERIERARKRLNETKYNLLSNNCETFAHACCIGKEVSMQAKKVTCVFGATVGVFAGSIAGYFAASNLKKDATKLEKMGYGIVGGVAGALGGAKAGYEIGKYLYE